MIKDGLYHKDVFLPKELAIPQLSSLIVSRHAQTRSEQLNVRLPRDFIPQIGQVIEAEVVQGKLHKIVVRQPWNAAVDICYPLLVQTKVIKTVWTNSRTDTHLTLDKTRYVS